MTKMTKLKQQLNILLSSKKKEEEEKKKNSIFIDNVDTREHLCK